VFIKLHLYSEPTTMGSNNWMHEVDVLVSSLGILRDVVDGGRAGSAHHRAGCRTKALTHVGTYYFKETREEILKKIAYMKGEAV
jgi:hypothetical protein